MLRVTHAPFLYQSGKKRSFDDVILINGNFKLFSRLYQRLSKLTDADASSKFKCEKRNNKIHQILFFSICAKLVAACHSLKQDSICCTYEWFRIVQTVIWIELLSDLWSVYTSETSLLYTCAPWFDTCKDLWCLFSFSL